MKYLYYQLVISLGNSLSLCSRNTMKNRYEIQLSVIMKKINILKTISNKAELIILREIKENDQKFMKNYENMITVLMVDYLAYTKRKIYATIINLFCFIMILRTIAQLCFT